MYYVPRLPLSLDPLIAEAKRRARHRRLAFLVGFAIVAAGAVAALSFMGSGNGSPAPAGKGAAGHGFQVARYSGLLSFRYPAGWRRHDRCIFKSLGPLQPLTLLATANVTRACANPTTITYWPPRRIPLGRNGVVAWLELLPSYAKLGDTGINVLSPAPNSYCAHVGAQRLVTALLSGPHRQLVLGACLRGPDVASSEADIRQLLASVRWFAASGAIFGLRSQGPGGAPTGSSGGATQSGHEAVGGSSHPLTNAVLAELRRQRALEARLRRAVAAELRAQLRAQKRSTSLKG